MINSRYVYYSIKSRELNNVSLEHEQSRKTIDRVAMVIIVIIVIGSIIAGAYILAKAIHYKDVFRDVHKDGQIVQKKDRVGATSLDRALQVVGILLVSPAGWCIAPAIIAVSFNCASWQILQKITQLKRQRLERKYPEVPLGGQALVSLDEYKAYVRQVQVEDLSLLIFRLDSPQEKEKLIQTIGFDQYLQALRKGAVRQERIIAYLPWTEGFDALKAHITPELLEKLKANPPSLSLFCCCAKQLKTSDRIRLAKMLLATEVQLFPYTKAEPYLGPEHFPTPKDPLSIDLKDLRRCSDFFSMDSLQMEASTLGRAELFGFERCHLFFSQFIHDSDRENLNALSFLLFTEGDYEEIDTPSHFKFINKYFAPLFNTLMHFMTEEERASCGVPKQFKTEQHR